MFNIWFIFTLILMLAIVITLLGILQAFLVKINLHDGGAGFEECTNFSKETQEKLIQNYSRILGTLQFWKNQALLYERLHKSAVTWSMTSVYLIPILIQAYDPENIWCKLFLTIFPAFSGLLITFSKGFKAEELYRSFRTGESEFFDLRRRLLDSPESLGNNEKEQIEKYFLQVEKIRQITRDAELSNPPTANPL